MTASTATSLPDRRSSNRATLVGFTAILMWATLAPLATLAAMVLGTLAAGAIARSRFFGQEVVSLLLVLPIALPGIVTGVLLALPVAAVANVLLHYAVERYRASRIYQGEHPLPPETAAPAGIVAEAAPPPQDPPPA